MQVFPFFEVYNVRMLPELGLGDRVKMRKPHPCGGLEWVVVRLGADIGIQCQTCGHRVLLPRRDLAKRIKGILAKGTSDAANA
jgi:hypothetical protein